MADGMTDRLALPYLQPGQAQKEVTHNEALARLDFLMQPVVYGVGLAAPPQAPSLGEAWIVGAGATEDWQGHDGSIAAWTAGGWRFAMPFEGLAAWSVVHSGLVRYGGGGWRIGAQGNAIATPAGGSVVDVEGRAATAAILRVMRAQGLVAS